MLVAVGLIGHLIVLTHLRFLVNIGGVRSMILLWTGLLLRTFLRTLALKFAVSCPPRRIIFLAGPENRWNLRVLLYAICKEYTISKNIKFLLIIYALP